MAQLVTILTSELGKVGNNDGMLRYLRTRLSSITTHAHKIKNYHFKNSS